MRQFFAAFFVGGIMTKYFKQIMDILNNEYKDADCTLDYKDPLELMIATILAAQCTDARVNIVMKDFIFL